MIFIFFWGSSKYKSNGSRAKLKEDTTLKHIVLLNKEFTNNEFDTHLIKIGEELKNVMDNWIF